MDTSQIINTMKSTPYKYTFASKVKDYLKKDTDGDADQIIDQLRVTVADPVNADISKPLKEVLKYFRRNMF